MKKLIFLLSFILSFVISFAQTGDVNANRVIARQSLFVRDRWVDTIKNDTLNLDNKFRSLMTADAVYEFVKGRTSSLSGGSGWLLQGNAGTNQATDFIGTSDSAAWRWRINNQRFGYFPRLGSIVSLDSGLVSQIYIGHNAGDKDTANRNGNIAIGNYAMASYPASSSQRNSASTVVGHQALVNYIGGGSEANSAFGWRVMYRNLTGFRNTGVGLNAMYNLKSGHRNTGLGAFALEWASTGNDNTSVGESSMRNHTIGSFNAALGNSSGYSNTGSVIGITGLTSSSDWTTATAIISPPDANPFGFNPSVQATATVQISGGQIVGITMTDIGRGYTQDGNKTITFIGDGTSASATLVIVGGSNNTYLGSVAGYTNRIGYGNIYAGVESGYGDGSASQARIRDSLNVILGFNATVNRANPMTDPVINAIAIGNEAKVGASNSAVIGGTGSNQVAVGIGTETPSQKSLLDLSSTTRYALLPRMNTVQQNAIVSPETGATLYNTDSLGEVVYTGLEWRIKTTAAHAFFNKGITLNRYASAIPTINTLLDNGLIKISPGAVDAGISQYKGGTDFGGNTHVTYRTNNADINVKTALNFTQTLMQWVGYTPGTDGSGVAAGYHMRFRSAGTAKTTSTPTFFEMLLRDTIGATGSILPKFRVWPWGSIWGDNVTSVSPDAGAIMTLSSTNKGFLTSRLTAAQEALVPAGVEGTFIYNTDSSRARIRTASGFKSVAYLNDVANKVDSVKLGSSQFTDTLVYYSGGVSYTGGFIDRQSGLIMGGVVTWDSLLVFSVSPAIYRIDGVRYTSPQTNITLDPADPTNPRIDVIAVDNTGTVVKITGTPAADPAVPQIDPSTQVLLTSVLVNAAATVPATASSVVIYDENTEWTGSVSGLTANFAEPSNAFRATLSTDVGAFTNGQYFQYTNGGPVTLTSYSALSFHINLKSTFANNTRLQISFYYNNSQLTNEITINHGQYGFDRTQVGTYQEITIPLSAFSQFNVLPTGMQATRVRVRLSGSNANGLYFDYARLLGGFTTNTNNYITDVFRKTGTDSVFKVVNGNASFAFSLTRGLDDVLAVVQPLTANRSSSFGNFTWTITSTQTSGSLNSFNVNNSGNGGAIGATTTGLNAAINAGNSTSGAGIVASSNTGTGVVGTSTTTQGGSFSNTPTSTGTVVNPLRTTRRSSNTPAANMGGGLEMYLESTTSDDRIAGAIYPIWETATDASRTSEIQIDGVENGTTEKFMRIQKDGTTIVNNGADSLAKLSQVRSAILNQDDVAATSLTTNLIRMLGSGPFVMKNGGGANVFTVEHSSGQFNALYDMNIDGKLEISTGVDKSIGTATMVGGTVTVNTAMVTASSKIFVTVNTPGGTQGFLSVPTASIVAGTSFVINSTSGTETSTVNWWIIN